MAANPIPDFRERVVKPRTTRFTPRAILAVKDGVGLTEQGEVITNVPRWLYQDRTGAWVMTGDPASFLAMLLTRFGDEPWFTYSISDTRDPDGIPCVSIPRIQSIGFDTRCPRTDWDGIYHAKSGPCRICNAPNRRKTRRAIVSSPRGMFNDPTQGTWVGDSLPDLLRFAVDIRDWCQENDLPIKATLPGHAASLFRDSRFWPDARGKVPWQTNARLRPMLPGVHQELAAPKRAVIQDGVQMDLRRAYHRAAQDTPMPDPTTMVVRGYFPLADQEDPPLWAPRDSALYDRTIAQPGFIWVLGSQRQHRARTFYLPAQEPGRRVIGLWTNELSLAIANGLTVEGIVAAATSTGVDQGFPRYGAWAESAIDTSTPYRTQWLKPTLHSLYGLSAVRPKLLIKGDRIGYGERMMMAVGSRMFRVRARTLDAQEARTTNVAALGVLQSAIRAKVIDHANQLERDGVEVYYVGADSIHHGPQQTRLLAASDWTSEPITHLVYVDDVSWYSDQGDHLPGRTQAQRTLVKRRDIYARAKRYQPRPGTGEGPDPGAGGQPPALQQSA